MRPEWHRMIEDWVQRCAKRHPHVVGIDLTLRHGDQRHPEEVDVEAPACGRRLRAARHAPLKEWARPAEP